jgi:hypothetical protein
MNVDKRQSSRIQIPEGREHATLFVGQREVGVRILDESAGGFAVALLAEDDIQQNQLYTLKTATGLYETRVARIEHYQDGKLLGLMRLRDLSAAGENELKAAGIGSGWGVGIGAAAVAGLLLCLLAAYFIQRSLAH